MQILPYVHSSPYPFYTNHIGYVKGKSSTDKEKSGNCPNTARPDGCPFGNKHGTRTKHFNREQPTDPGLFGRAVDKMDFVDSMDFITIARIITNSGRHWKSIFPYNRKSMENSAMTGLTMRDWNATISFVWTI